MKPFKIAFIGAGSLGFTRRLLGDLLAVPEFRNLQIAFHDIDPDNLDRVTRLCQRDIEANSINIRIRATTDRVEAVRNARYVINTVRIGGLEAFETDIEIPLKYGVDQCVGDTLGPGGIMYAQRTIPFMLELCADIRQHAEAGCRLLNYSNPMAMNTWACLEHGKVDTIGLCHGVQGGAHFMAAVLDVPRDELDFICAGINHQTWYIQVRHRGRDMTQALRERANQLDWVQKQEPVRLDMMNRFGFFSTESNGHLSEYVPWYRKRAEELPKWVDFDSWIRGETAGYLRICREGRNWFEQDFPNWMKEPPSVYAPDKRSEEHGSYIIEALETGRLYRGHFNVRNGGVITNLPADCVIEAPGYVDGNGINMPVVGDLPLGCAAVCNASISVQRMATRAAVTGDVTLLKQAMLLDPLTAAVCTTEEVWHMTDAMLAAQAPWLPQFRDSIADAKQCLAESGFTPPYPENKGAARLPERSVEDMALEAEKTRKLAQASDKGEMTQS